MDFPIVTVTIHLVNISRTLTMYINIHHVHPSSLLSCKCDSYEDLLLLYFFHDFWHKLCQLRIFSKLSLRSFVFSFPHYVHYTNHQFLDYNYYFESDGSPDIPQIHKFPVSCLYYYFQGRFLNGCPNFAPVSSKLIILSPLLSN